MQKLEYKLRYLWRCVAHFLGLCPKCLTGLNYTRTKRPICPQCGH